MNPRISKHTSAVMVFLSSLVIGIFLFCGLSFGADPTEIEYSEEPLAVYEPVAAEQPIKPVRRGTVPPPPTRQKDLADLVLGIGLIISPDYKDVLDDAYHDYSVQGGFGWLDLQLGVRFNVTDKFSLTPGIDLLLNFGSGDVSFTNTIVVPSVSGRYAFLPGPSVYIRGELNLNIPNMGADRIDTETKGIGFGGAFGYAFGNGLELELGYLYVPVEAEWRGRTEDKNFGGVLFKFGAAL